MFSIRTRIIKLGVEFLLEEEEEQQIIKPRNMKFDSMTLFNDTEKSPELFFNTKKRTSLSSSFNVKLKHLNPIKSVE